MLLEQFFGSRFQSKPAYTPKLMEGSKAVTQLTQEAFAIFLNDYVAHGFNEMEGDRESQGHFYIKALEIAKALEVSGTKGNLQLEASAIAEQQRQRARRCYHEICEMAQSVLIDQRNYLLALLINARASEVGCASQNRPYSGIETSYGQPCHAFALKLLTDAALGRGFAKGLQEDAVTMMEHHIAKQAESEIQHFIAVFEEEEEAP